MSDDDHLYTGIRRHLSSFFAGHSIEEHMWTLGPHVDDLPRLRIAEIAPGPKTALWVYASIGAWEARPDPMLEFLIVAPRQNLRHVELLAMTAWYHRDRGLGEGHHFPIGEPWLRGSACDQMLVSLPYPFGPDLELCELGDRNPRYLWLLPITHAERDFMRREGQEALEQRFDEQGLEYWEPDRASVV